MTLTASSASPTVADSDDPPTVSMSPVATVTAVLVAHDGARWLPRALAAIEAQPRRPERLVAVDTGSKDESPGILRRTVPRDDVHTVGRTVGFGDAVRAG